MPRRRGSSRARAARRSPNEPARSVTTRNRSARALEEEPALVLDESLARRGEQPAERRCVGLGRLVEDDDQGA